MGVRRKEDKKRRNHRWGGRMKGHSFLNDLEKYQDFRDLTKEEFLKFYSYLTEEDYKATEEEEKRFFEVEMERLRKRANEFIDFISKR